MVGERNAEFAALVNRPDWQAPRKLSHLVARDLRGMILRGELIADQAIPSETDLLHAFGVSRDTLREALRILESESLIQIRRGRGGGAVVQRPLPRTVARHVSLLLEVRGATLGEIQEARLVLEPPAAARLVGLSADDAGTLAELHDLELSRLDDPLAGLTALTAFDQAVFRLAGNKTIAVVSSVFRDVIGSQARVEDLPDRGSPVLAELADRHGAFLRAAVAGDAEGAQASWAAYLSETAGLLGRSAATAPFAVASVWRAQGSGDTGGNGGDKMAASIAMEIRTRMAEGKLGDGDQLAPMPELAAEFGVSRPTIRECLRILEGEGLIDLRTGSRTGARVLSPSTVRAGQLASVVLAAARTRMVDVLEARQLIEPAVIELMAARADRQTLAALAERVVELKAMADNTPAFVDFIEGLERQAFAAARNPAISIALEMIHWVNIRCRRDVVMRAVSVPQVIRSNRRMVRDFEAVLQAAEQCDVTGAGKAWARHFERISPFFHSSWGDRLIVDLFD